MGTTFLITLDNNNKSGCDIAMSCFLFALVSFQNPYGNDVPLLVHKSRLLFNGYIILHYIIFIHLSSLHDLSLFMYLFSAQSDLAALPFFSIILPGYILIKVVSHICSHCTELFPNMYLSVHVSICSWTCIYLIMAQSDLVALPPRNAWIFVLSVSAMLIFFLMYVNKSVYMYISTFRYIYIYIPIRTSLGMYTYAWKKSFMVILYIMVYDYEYVHDQN